MEPSSDHEREIASRIDQLASQGKLPLSAVADVAASLPFTLSKSETQFLVRYILFRRDNPK
jgi:hypothetical protein